VVRDGQRLEYTLNEGGKVSTAIEAVAAPVVTGPSLHGFILAHWNALLGGEKIAVRMIVLSKKETYGFDIRLADRDNGRTAFSIVPTSLLVRLALNPLRVEFDSVSRNVVRYAGRVPPLRRIDGKLKAFDADVRYTMHTASYR
jgi:hypothetical protein